MDTLFHVFFDVTINDGWNMCAWGMYLFLAVMCATWWIERGEQ